MGGRYQAYPEYEESGVDCWFDRVPSHWQIKRISYVALLKSGDSIVSEQIEAEGDYPVYGGNGHRGYTKNFNHDGSYILIGRQGALCGNINYGYGKFWASEHAVVVHPTLDMNFKWFGETLRAMDLNQYNVSAAQPGLAVANITCLKIPFPSVDEQEKIANFLDHETAKIDTLIEKQQQLIKLLKEKRQAVISHAVTKGLNPNAPMRDSGVEWLGDVPEHWVVRRLKHTSNLQSGIPKGKDLTGKVSIAVPMLRVANVQDGYLKLEDVHNMDIEPGQLERYTLEKGDVLMNEGGDNDKLGRGAVWQCEIEPCIHQNHVFAIRPYSIEPEWLDLVTRTSYAKFHFFRVAKQSTNLASISSTNIKETPLVIPPKKERVEIMEYVKKKIDVFDNAEEDCSAQVVLLQERRTALISAAVTGKIDVRNFNPEDGQSPEPSNTINKEVAA